MKIFAKVCGLALGLAVTGAVAAEAPTREVLGLSAATVISDACLAQAETEGKNLAVAVYDYAGLLITFAKMDGTTTGIGKLAQWKGYSAAIYGMSSAQTGKWNAPSAPGIATFPGGLPIYSDAGVLLGGVGVSGAAPSEDAACGQAGIDAAGLRSVKPE